MSKPQENFLGAVQGSNSLDGNKYGKPEAVAWELPFRRTDSEERKDGLASYSNIRKSCLYLLLAYMLTRN